MLCQLRSLTRTRGKPFVRTFSSNRVMTSNTETYDWAIIGAGPAGIATIGRLIQSGVSPKSIVWVDPSFAVGDFGTRWKEVSSNTTVALFKRFYETCPSFQWDAANPKYEISKMEPASTCILEAAAVPLRDITSNLRSQIASVQCKAELLSQAKGAWVVHTDKGEHIHSNNVVLALGAVPNSMAGKISGTEHLTEIPMEVALKPSALELACNPGDKVAVFGSSHSAVIIMRALLERGVEVVNVYRDPLRYAMYFPEFILFDDTGLKGQTAKWSRENLHDDENPPKGLTRVLTSDPSVADLLKDCSKVIYATGFTRRTIPVRGLERNLAYNPHCGVIAPGLFGCGIGFPQLNIDRFRNEEYRVGLWKFMDYLGNIVPLWKEYSVKRGIGQPKPKL